MGKISDIRYFMSFAEELDSKLGRISSLTGKHLPSIGNYHEYVIKDIIKNFLPKRFSLRTGFIYVDQNNISPQLDIIIVDENQGSGILAQFGDFVIVYPDSVSSVIEIKTKFNKKDFIDSSKKISEVKKISKLGRESKGIIGGFIFGFDGAELTPGLLDMWYKSVNIQNFNEYPDAILSLKKGMLNKWNSDKPNKGHYFILEGDSKLKWKSLSIFLASLLKFCELQSGMQSNPFEKYAFINDTLMSKEYLLYGKGLITSVQ